MKKVTHRILSLFLVLAMTVAYLPQPALTAKAAETVERTGSTADTETTGTKSATKENAKLQQDASENGTEPAEESGEETLGKPSEETRATEETASGEETSAAGETDNAGESTAAKETDDIGETAATGGTDAAQETADSGETSGTEETSSGQSGTEETGQEDSGETEASETDTTETEETEELTATEEKTLRENTDIRGMGTYNNGKGKWTLYLDGRLVIEGPCDGSFPRHSLDAIHGPNNGDLYVHGGYYPCGEWGKCAADIKSVEFRNVTGVEDASYLFAACTNLERVDFSGFDAGRVSTMFGMFSSCFNLTEINFGENWDTGNVTNMNYMFQDCLALTELDLSGWDTHSVTDMNSVFNGCESLTSLDLSGWNTGNVSDAGRMFRWTASLEDLNLTGWDTSSLTHMAQMFCECGLTSLDLSSWNTSNVECMSEMFKNAKLTDLNLSGWDLSNVAEIYGMCYGCTKLENLNLSGWKVKKKAGGLWELFTGCRSLTSLDLSSFDLSEITDDRNAEDMLTGCYSLKSIRTPTHLMVDIPLPDTDGTYSYRKPNGAAVKVLPWGLEESITITTDRMAGIGFQGENFTIEDILTIDCTAGNGVDREKVVDMGTSIPFSFTVVPKDGYVVRGVKPAREDSTIALERGSKQNEYTVSAADPESGYTRDELIVVEVIEISECELTFSYDEDAEEIIVVNSGQAGTGKKPASVKVSNAYRTNLYVKVKDSSRADPLVPVLYLEYDSMGFDYMVYEKDTDKMDEDEKKLVQSGYYVFRLGNLYESAAIRVRIIYEMSDDDIAHGDDGWMCWVIDKNGRMKMKGADNLGYVPWSQYQQEITSVVVDWKGATNLSNLFSGFKNLKSADLSGLDASSVEHMDAMFKNCESLTTLDLGSLDLRNVTNMDSMFYNCKSLTTLKLGNLKSGKATSMNSMFYNCRNLTSVDFGNFDASSLESAEYAFYNCESLTTLDLGGFHTGTMRRMREMFYNCKNLKTLNLSGFHTDGADLYGLFGGCDALEEIQVPTGVSGGVSLPPTDGTQWRLPDGTAVYELPFGLQESVTIKSSHTIIRFTGDSFTIKDKNGQTVENSILSARKGAKDAVAITVEPKEGYLLKGVRCLYEDSTILIQEGAELGQYVISPADTEQGYARDEELYVETIQIQHFYVSVNYPSEGVADTAVSNGTSWTEGRPDSAYIANAYDTTLYVKPSEAGGGKILLPAVTVESVDENGNWYRRTVPYRNDASSMEGKGKELVQDGYFAFGLGRLYGSASVTVEIRTIYQIRFETTGFPDNVHMVQYVKDTDGIIHRQDCENIVRAAGDETVYFQAEWDDTPDGAYRWCQPEVTASMPGSDSAVTVGQHTFVGVEGTVWGITPQDDTTVTISLVPHTVALTYMDGDIRELAVSGSHAALSDDRKSVKVYGGDTLSLTFRPAENIRVKDASCDGGTVTVEEKDGICAITVQDMEAVRKIKSISISTEDALGRYLLSDMKYGIQLEQNTCSYTGSAIEPGVRKVAVYLPGSLKETELKAGTDYTVSYLDNINVGTASVIITAAENSIRYKGSCSTTFEIVKAAPPDMGERQIHMDISCAGTTQQLDLSDIITADTPYEKEVSPTGFRLDLNDPECTLGDILKGDPVLQGSTLTYGIWGDAGKHSAPAVVVVQVSFASYRDARLVLRIRLARKEEVVFAGTVTAEDKTYDGMPVEIRQGQLYVESVDGRKPENAETIMEQLRDSLVYCYTGTGDTAYNSRTAPEDAGTYRVAVTISGENVDYQSGYTDVGGFTISKRPLGFAADDLELCTGDTSQKEYGYQITGEGLTVWDSIVREPVLSCSIPDMTQAGEYAVTVDIKNVRIRNDLSGRDTTGNYQISGKDGVLRVVPPKTGSHTVTYSLTGHGDDIVRSGMEAGSLLARPKDPEAAGYVFLGWYKDETLTKTWDFATDTIQDDITLYAGWAEAVSGNRGAALCIQTIADQPYTGKALKPVVTVYAGDGRTLLKAGRDYSVSYTNNTEADTGTRKFGSDEIPKGGLGVRQDGTTDTSGGFNEKLAYVTVTGKGNYAGTVCMNFHVTAAVISDTDGFSLKYTDQFEAKTGRNAKIISTLKYKQTLKYKTDYTLSVEREDDGSIVTLTPKGELPLAEGTYRMTISGQGNYTGTITKNLYVAPKTALMKNAKVTYTKTINNATREQLADGITQTDIRVSVGGKELQPEDYEVSYSGNHAIGTAAMTISGRNGYAGAKSVTFKIRGLAFKEKEFEPLRFAEMTYNGTAQTQNEVELVPRNGGEPLTYGTDYIIGYKNNIKKGKVSLIFTARPSSGYSGSFKKTLTMKPLDLESELVVKDGITSTDSGLMLTEGVPCRKGGAVPSGRYTLYLERTGTALKEGTDYTVKYGNNKEISDGTAYMTISGKGNFTGSMTVYFDIVNASLSRLYREGGIAITTSPMRFMSRMVPDPEGDEGDRIDKYDGHEYEPSVKIRDGKKDLKRDVDYTISYIANSQDEVRDWQGAAPYVEIRGMGNYGGADGNDEGEVISVPLSIYQKKLTADNIYVVYGEEAGYTYTGQQVTPEVTVYFGKASDVKKARMFRERDEGALTAPKPDDNDGEDDSYGLTKLSPQTGEGGGNYRLEYGANIQQGKNGTIKITGIGGCTGSVTVKFAIGRKPIYNQNEQEEPDE